MLETDELEESNDDQEEPLIPSDSAVVEISDNPNDSELPRQSLESNSKALQKIGNILSISEKYKSQLGWQSALFEYLLESNKSGKLVEYETCILDDNERLEMVVNEKFFTIESQWFLRKEIHFRNKIILGLWTFDKVKKALIWFCKCYESVNYEQEYFEDLSNWNLLNLPIFFTETNNNQSLQDLIESIFETRTSIPFKPTVASTNPEIKSSTITDFWKGCWFSVAASVTSVIAAIPVAINYAWSKSKDPFSFNNIVTEGWTYFTEDIAKLSATEISNTFFTTFAYQRIENFYDTLFSDQNHNQAGKSKLVAKNVFMTGILVATNALIQNVIEEVFTTKNISTNIFDNFASQFFLNFGKVITLVGVWNIYESWWKTVKCCEWNTFSVTTLSVIGYLIFNLLQTCYTLYPQEFEIEKFLQIFCENTGNGIPRILASNLFYCAINNFKKIIFKTNNVIHEQHRDITTNPPLACATSSLIRATSFDSFFNQKEEINNIGEQVENQQRPQNSKSLIIG